MQTYIIVSEQYGRAVHALTDLRKGQIVEVNELLVLSPEDTERVNRTGLKYYTFAYDMQDTSRPRDCICLGNGELFNHSDEANVRYIIEEVGGRKKMFFYTTREVKSGEQLFIDYRQDTPDIMVDDYLSEASLTD